MLPGCGAFAVAGSLLAGTGGLGAAVLEQGVRGGQRAVLLDQLGDPGPGHAQPEADLGVGQALARLQAGLPQPGGAEDRRAAHLVNQAPGAVLAVAGADPRQSSRQLQSAPSGVTLKDGGVQLADMRGKGGADLLVGEGIARGFYENEFSGEWGRYHSLTQVPSFDLKDPNVRLVDLNGDGVIDVLATLDHHFLYIRNCTRDGHLEFAPPLAIPRQHDLNAWPDVFFAQPQERVRLADMSGDGLQDIVLLHEGRVDYWPNLGHGRWGRRITLMNGPHLPWRYDPKRLFLADINGDGLANLVYVDAGSVRYWINQSGNRWSDEQVFACTPQVTIFDTVRMADVNGTGAAGIVWSSDWSAVTRQANYRYLDFTGGEKPLLLNCIDNHSGAVTRIEYRPSTEFYAADQEAGSPWMTSLPFPVNVVRKVTVHDGVTRQPIDQSLHVSPWLL